MKPITEERRQALIEFIGAAFESMKGNEPAYPDKFDLEEMTHQALEIALASLTAEIFMYGISDPDGKAHFSECCVDDDGSSVSDEVCALNDGETDLPDGYRVVPLYTAPPVPVIKLPSVQDLIDEYKYQASPHDIRIWNFSLSVINRLNGLGE
ncbi:hypothetical protein [Tatumella morbirosei]|uniref:hypothetical protein n=1 Tax=Tatumella morbirosei TaxID=642227 RepID=UPI000907DEDB